MKIPHRIKLVVTPDQAKSIDKTFLAYNEAATEAARIGFEEKIRSTISLNYRTYRHLRQKYGLPGQMAVRVIGKAARTLALKPRKPPQFRPYGAVIYDPRMAKRNRKNGYISLQTLDGRLKLPYHVPDRSRDAVAGEWKCAVLLRIGGAYYIEVPTEVAEPVPYTPTATIGVDVGIANIVTLSTGETFSGEHLLKARERYAKQRSGLQSKGTRSAKRKLRKLSGREKRYAKEVNHVISRRVVDKAKALRAGLVIEDLKGIRRQRLGKKTRTLVNRWGFSQLRNFLTYKAALAGVPLTVISPANTSQTCSACGHCEKANRRGKKFSCKSCGHKSDADLNASINIARRGQGAEVNRPMATEGNPPVANSEFALSS